MNKNILMIGAVAAIAVMFLNKARAQNAPAASMSAPPPSKNVNDQMWTSLLGVGWKALKDAQNDDGSPAFLMRNFLGQTTTSDGVVVSDEMEELFPYTYGNYDDIQPDLTAPSDGVDYLQMMGW